MSAWWEGLRELQRYASALAGLAIIVLLLGLSLYAIIAIPYNEASRLWRGGEGIWDENPRTAWPTWINLWSSTRLPDTIVVDSRRRATRTTEDLGEGVRKVNASMAFDFPYEDFPSEVTLFLAAKFQERQPHVMLRWRQPDGQEIPLEDRSPGATERYAISLDEELKEALGNRAPEEGLFASASGESLRVLPGHYVLLVEAYLFEPDSELDLKLVVYGKVHGVAGTDDQRRDLLIALLWGTPIALTFGLLAAVGSTLLALSIAAIGSWYGGRLDATIQRLVEINSMLPHLAILIMVGVFYSRSIWVMLGTILLLSIFSLGIKTYRSIFLSLKQSPYIEAARVYGASNMRVIFRYMVPRVIPMLIPAFVTGIPNFVFLEASLSILGLGDPILPTWGKLLHEALNGGALYKGYYYWMVQPALLLMLTGLSFAMLGFTLDRVFNPRLRVQ